MTHPTSHPVPAAGRHRARAIGVALMVALVGQAGWSAPVTQAAAPTAAKSAPPAAPAADDPNGGLRPSIHYEEVVAHAADRIDFEPGARVTVGFTPRPDDHWKVGGVSPRALPHGRLDGATIRGQGHAPGKGPDATVGPDRGGPDEPAPTPDLTATPTPTPIPTPLPSPVASDPPPSLAPDPSPIVEPAPLDPVDQPSPDPATLVEAANVAWSGSTVEAPADAEARVSSTGLRREVFGFLPYWELSSSSTTLDFSKLSTIAYFGVGADGNGNLQKKNADGSTTVGWSGWTSSRMTNLITTAHQQRTRVVLTVQSFAWTSGQLDRQKRLLGSSTARANLARQIAAAVRDRGADGVNLDFEPLASGYAEEFTSLVRRVRTELNAVHSGYQLTFDTTGHIGNYPIEAATASGGADAIFIMGYDYRTAGSSPVGSVAPLGRTGYDIRDTVAAYVARVSPSKLILGVPYYGRAWSTDDDDLGAANISGTKYGASTTVVYDTAVEYLAQHGRRYDATEGVAWTTYRRENCTTTYGCVTPWRQLYIDDATALRAKYDLVNRYALRGAGIWALGYDGTRPELWKAIHDKFVAVPDTAPPVVGIKALPRIQASPQFDVAWSGTDASGIASYDVQVSTGGTWYPWLTGTAATSAVYRGQDGRNYAFRVRARDTKGNVGGWTVNARWTAPTSLATGGFGRVTADGLSLRTSASTSAARVATVSSGAVLAITGGPVSANGYTWYRVTGPLTGWGIVGAVTKNAWIAARSSSATYLVPTTAPSSSAVRAVISGLTIGAPNGVRVFSPEADGVQDGLRFTWTNRRALDSIELRVQDADGTLVDTLPLVYRGAGPQSFTWNGRADGARLPDGRYLATLVGTVGGTTVFNPSPRLRFATELDIYGVRIDTVNPSITPAASPAVISPNGDGTADTAALSWKASEPITGSIRVMRGTTTIRAWAITQRATGSVRWDGRNSAGTMVPDGAYVVRVSARDAAGNGITRDVGIRLDRTLRGVVTSASRFYPHDGDRLAPSTRLTYTLTRQATVTLAVYRGSTLIRTLYANKVRPAGAYGSSWNGTTAAGAFVPRGSYTMRLVATSAAGTTIATRSVLVDAFRTELSATTLVPGQRLTVTVTPVEPLASAPRTSLTQAGGTAVTKTGVLLASGRYRVTFTVAAGAAGAARILVLGRDRLGGTNRSYAAVTVR